jgi:predicted CoA-binding protein
MSQSATSPDGGHRRGYRTIPVNPNAAGDTINGERCHPSLAEVPEPVDMVDVFRRPEVAGGVVDEAITIGAKVVWMQLGVRDDDTAARAEARGLKVVMSRCRAIEIPRLGLPTKLTLTGGSEWGPSALPASWHSGTLEIGIGVLWPGPHQRGAPCA